VVDVPGARDLPAISGSPRRIANRRHFSYGIRPQTIDPKAKIVCPGFIDPTRTTIRRYLDKLLSSSSEHGITPS